MSDAEQRIHARIHVSTKIEVSTPAGMFEAELKDLSKGGARFEVAQPIAEVGETVELLLPSLDRGEIAVMAAVIRAFPSDNGGQLYAVRFDVVEPSMQQGLADLMEVLLSASGGGRRAHARVARRVEVRVGQLAEFRAILEDVSGGGLTMAVDQPLVLYEELDITLPDLAGKELLILSARVVNQRAVEADGKLTYRVGFEFIHLRPEASRCLHELLRTVLEALDEPSAA